LEKIAKTQFFTTKTPLPDQTKGQKPSQPQPPTTQKKQKQKK